MIALSIQMQSGTSKIAMRVLTFMQQLCLVLGHFSVRIPPLLRV
jgi:hypothetical protein